MFRETWVTISNRWSPYPAERVKPKAEQGDISAQYYLAIAYLDGNGVSKDQAEAFKVMKLLAEKGMPLAQGKLGWMLQYGIGAQTNLQEAASWYEKASNQGDPLAEYNLGRMYSKSIYFSEDDQKAVRLYRLAAEQGHALAQNNLGWAYQQGLGVPQSIREATNWYQKSADQGEPYAKINLAWIYATGKYGEGAPCGQGAEAQIRTGGVPPNHELAEKLMRQAVDLNSAEGQYKYGALLYGEFDNEGHQDTNHFPEAGEWFKKSAEQGFANAQYSLAEMLHSGKLGDNQRANCVPWFLKAAAQGHPEAQAEVGRLSEFYPDSDLLKTIDPIDMVKRAADQGDLRAQFDLARRYHVGDGVQIDPVESFNWMEKVANRGISDITVSVDAHFYLGVMYEKGLGVAKNLTNAFRLYKETAVIQENDYAIGNKGDPYYRVGQMYENGEGVQKDDSIATKFYFIGLQFGYAPELYDAARSTAIDNLLNLYVLERGLPENKEDIGRQLNMIRKNHPIMTPKGQYLMGQIYFQSKIVPKDLVEAAAWLRLSANQNFPDAAQSLARAECEMSESQKEASKIRFNSLSDRVAGARKTYEMYRNYRHLHSFEFPD